MKKVLLALLVLSSSQVMASDTNRPKHETIELKNSLSLDGYTVAFRRDRDKYHNNSYTTDYNHLRITPREKGFWTTSDIQKDKLSITDSYTYSFERIRQTIQDSVCESHSKRCDISYKTSLTVDYHKGFDAVKLYQYSLSSDEAWVLDKVVTIKINTALFDTIFEQKIKDEIKRKAYEEEQEAELKAYKKEQQREKIIVMLTVIGIIIGLTTTALFLIIILRKNMHKVNIRVGKAVSSASKVLKRADNNIKKRKLQNVAIEETVRQVARNSVNSIKEDQLKQAIIDAVNAGDFDKAQELTKVLNVIK